MQNGHGRESYGCVELEFLKKICSLQLSGEQMSSGGGSIVLDALKSAAL